MSKGIHTTINEIHNLRFGHARTSFLMELILLLQSPCINMLEILSIAKYVSVIQVVNLQHEPTDGSVHQVD